jgi:ABC-type antimicrobial peptide transport system permease subunit
MDIELLKNIAFVLAAMIGAAIILVKFRHFLDRKPGEDWKSFLQRATAEKNKDKEAQRTMFGSLGATVRVHVVVLAFMLAFAYSTVVPALMFAMVIYLAIGFFVSNKTANDAKAASHPR